MNEASQLDINAIMLRLPHRYPFLLIDRVLEYVPGQRIRALKNVTFNEPYFTGHFPHRPLMPGVMIIEALAQAAGLLAFLSADEIPDNKTRLRENDADLERELTVAEVAGEEVAHAQMMIAPDLKSAPVAQSLGEEP